MNGNSGRKPDSFFRAAGEILTPVIILYLSVLGATVAVMGAAGLITGAGSLDAEALLRACPQLPLISSVCGYALALAALRQTVRYDELRFGRTISLSRTHVDWSARRCAAYTVFVSIAGFLWSRLLLSSGLPDIFTGYSAQASASFSGQFPVLLFLSYVLLGPAAEELVFRCCVFRRSRARMGLYPAVLLSSALFGIWHGNMIQFLYASVLGLLLAWGYEKSGRISVCLAAHICANLLAFAFAVFNWI